MSVDDNQPGPNISLEPAEVTLKPGGSAQLAIRIQVPDDAEVGYWQSHVLFDAAPAGARDVSIVGQVGVTIGTEVIRPVSDVTWSFPRIADSTDQIVFVMAGRNTGNFTTRFEGTAFISGIIDGGNSSLLAVSEPVEVGETASLQVIWDDSPLFAIKKVTLDLGSGVGAPVERQAYLVVFPWKSSLILATMLAIAAVGVRFRLLLAKVFSRNGRKVG